MKTYALLWGIGVALFVLGFALLMADGSELFTVLIVVGVALGVAGFLSFAKRDQGTTA